MKAGTRVHRAGLPTLLLLTASAIGCTHTLRPPLRSSGQALLPMGSAWSTDARSAPRPEIAIKAPNTLLLAKREAGSSESQQTPTEGSDSATAGSQPLRTDKTEATAAKAPPEDSDPASAPATPQSGNPETNTGSPSNTSAANSGATTAPTTPLAGEGAHATHPGEHRVARMFLEPLAGLATGLGGAYVTGKALGCEGGVGCFFAEAGAAFLTVPIGVRLVGGALGGQGSYGWALLGSGIALLAIGGASTGDQEQDTANFPKQVVIATLIAPLTSMLLYELDSFNQENAGGFGRFALLPASIPVMGYGGAARQAPGLALIWE